MPVTNAMTEIGDMSSAEDASEQETAQDAVQETAQDAVQETTQDAVQETAQDAQTAATAGAADRSTAAEMGSPPIRLAIPAISLAATIEPMAWRVMQVDGTRQAVWEIPEVNVGWHINSSMPGMAGNVILSGHHLSGGGVFAPLARGEVTVADQVLLTNADGQTVIYQISEIGEPIPVSGASSAEVARLNSYQAPTTEPKLTLITGWPDFSDTHYLIIVADYIGEME